MLYNIRYNEYNKEKLFVINIIWQNGKTDKIFCQELPRTVGRWEGE